MAIKVLIVDDSALVRRILSEKMEQDRELEVVGAVADVYAARDKLVRFGPDVVVLDLEMPSMDGLSFLMKMNEHRPTPTIVFSAHASDPAQAEAARKLGAKDVIAKPQGAEGMDCAVGELIAKIKKVGQARKGAARLQVRPGAVGGSVIAIGASTGGGKVLKTILQNLPSAIPGILLVQHMTPHMAPIFAQVLGRTCGLEVKLAEQDDRVLPGRVLIAPGGLHMHLVGFACDYRVSLRDGDLVCFQKPSAEVLFQSVARTAGPRAVGVILTGMGRDGADGMLAMKRAGARTIAQDESTSAVFGMPREAILLGAIDKVLPEERIAAEIVSMVNAG